MFDTVELLIALFLVILSCYIFIILFLIRLIFLLFFLERIIISSTGFLHNFSIVPISYYFRNLLLKISPFLRTSFLEAGFKESSPVSNNYFLCFLENDENLCPLTYFFVLLNITLFLFINNHCQINFVFYF